MIGIQIAKINFWRKLIPFFILIKMILPFGLAVFIKDSKIVEGKLTAMITSSGFGNIFHKDPLCGRLSKGIHRQKKCEEVLNSADFRTAEPDILYDRNNANLPLKSCYAYEPLLIVEQYDKVLSGRKITLKMFQCPFMYKNGAGKGNYYMSAGSDADALFLFIYRGPSRQPVGWYSSKPFQGN